MTLGQLYIAKILVTNPLDFSAVVTARIDAPIGFFAVEPYLMEVLLPPRESKILEFELTPHKEHVGPLEIHTILSIRVQGEVLEEQQLTREIREIIRPSYLVATTFAISILIGVSAIGYSIRRHNRKRSVKTQERS